MTAQLANREGAGYEARLNRTQGYVRGLRVKVPLARLIVSSFLMRFSLLVRLRLRAPLELIVRPLICAVCLSVCLCIRRFGWKQHQKLQQQQQQI